MGSGASSTGVATALENTSQGELEQALSGLTPEGRAKLAASLALFVANGAAAGAGCSTAPATAEAETEKPSESPYLKEYFEIQVKAMSETIDMVPLLLFDENAKEKMDSKRSETIALLKVPLQKSFKRHAVKGNDILDREEAAAFFKHLVEENIHFVKAYTASISMKSIETSVGMGAGILEAMADSDEDKAAFQDFQNAIRAGCEEGVKASVQMIEEAMKQQMADYLANRAERNAAAFKIMDKNEDGTLQLAEIEEILLAEMDSDKALAFMEALGFAPPQQQEIQTCFTNASLGDDGSECPDDCTTQ